MSVLYFPKPQPLSPNTKTVEVDGVRFRTVKGRKVRVREMEANVDFADSKVDWHFATMCITVSKGAVQLTHF